MRTYHLCRHEDVSKTSGTGIVAQAAEFDDGVVVVRWVAGMNATGVSSTTVFDSMEDLIKVHGHQGRTVLEPDLSAERMADLEQRLHDTETRLKTALNLLQSQETHVPEGLAQGSRFAQNH